MPRPYLFNIYTKYLFVFVTFRNMVNNNIAFCETEEAMEDGPQPLSMYFDGYTGKTAGVHFQYISDPKIQAIYPLHSYLR